MKYEYEIVYLYGSAETDKGFLNGVGSQGWRLVNVQSGWAYLMREIPDQAEKPASGKVTIQAEGEVKKPARKRTKKAAA